MKLGNQAVHILIQFLDVFCFVAAWLILAEDGRISESVYFSLLCSNITKETLVSSTPLHFALIAPQTILSAFAKADSSCF